MKLKINYLLLILLFNGFIFGQEPQEIREINEEGLNTADKILAIIYHPQGSHLILQSDLTSNIDNIPITKEEAIFMKLVEIDAEILQVSIPDEDVDRHWAKIQKEWNLTQEQILEKKKPFTLEQMREEIKKNIIFQNVIGYRVREKVIVDKSDVEAYCKGHPVYAEATYTISQGIATFDIGSETIKRIKLKRAIESGEIDKIVNWSAPIELKDSQIAQDKIYIKNLDIGSTLILESNDANNNNNGINLIRLISKADARELEYKEREPEVYNLLYKERFEKAFLEYKSKLFGQYELASDNNISKDPRIAVIKYID